MAEDTRDWVPARRARHLKHLAFHLLDVPKLCACQLRLVLASVSHAPSSPPAVLFVSQPIHGCQSPTFSELDVTAAFAPGATAVLESTSIRVILVAQSAPASRQTSSAERAKRPTRPAAPSSRDPAPQQHLLPAEPHRAIISERIEPFEPLPGPVPPTSALARESRSNAPLAAELNPSAEKLAHMLKTSRAVDALQTHADPQAAARLLKPDTLYWVPGKKCPHDVERNGVHPRTLASAQSEVRRRRQPETSASVSHGSVAVMPPRLETVLEASTSSPHAATPTSVTHLDDQISGSAVLSSISPSAFAADALSQEPRSQQPVEQHTAQLRSEFLDKEAGMAARSESAASQGAAPDQSASVRLYCSSAEHVSVRIRAVQLGRAVSEAARDPLRIQHSDPPPSGHTAQAESETGTPHDDRADPPQPVQGLHRPSSPSRSQPSDVEHGGATSRIVDVEARSESVDVDDAIAAEGTGSCWQLLCAARGGFVVFDAVMDLNADVSSVQQRMPLRLQCRALPACCLLLGLERPGLKSSGCLSCEASMRQLSAAIYPKLAPEALSAFLHDNACPQVRASGALRRDDLQPPRSFIETLQALVFPFPRRQITLPPSRGLHTRTLSAPDVARFLPRGTASSAVLAETAVVQAPALPRENHRRTPSNSSALSTPSFFAPSHSMHRLPSAFKPQIHAASHAPASNVLSGSNVSTASGSDYAASESGPSRPGHESATPRSFGAFYWEQAVPCLRALVELEQTWHGQLTQVKQDFERWRIEQAARVSKARDLQRARLRCNEVNRRSHALLRRVETVRREVVRRQVELQERRNRWAVTFAADSDFQHGIKRWRYLKKRRPDLLAEYRRTLGLLITRRHQLVISLLHHFRVEPRVVTRYQGGVLTDMQEMWMRRTCFNGCASQSLSRQPSAAGSTATIPRPHGLVNSVSSPFVEPPNASGQAPELDVTPSKDGLLTRAMPVVTIRGLEMSSDAARRAQLGELGWETTAHLNLTHMNAAYGYVAQVVLVLADLLDVPLLHTVHPLGSCSYVQQYLHRRTRATEHMQEVKDVHVQVPEGHAEAAHRIQQHPLFVVQGKHSNLKRFAWACFLLGTNVQAILHAYDLHPERPQFVLDNLWKIACAAHASGLRPGC